MSAQQRLARLARIAPPAKSTGARAPFVLLLVLLLGSGLLALLLLNASVNQGSFQLNELEKETERLTDEQQALQQEVDSRSAPKVLEKRATELGLVPGGNPAFLKRDGTVAGKPEPAPSSQGEPSVSGEPPGGAAAPGDGPSPGEARQPARSGPSDGVRPSGEQSGESELSGDGRVAE